jgi:hypothetical protein
LKLSVSNFLTHIKALVTGGGRDSNGEPQIDCGYLTRLEGVGLESLAPSAAVTATAGALTVTDGAGTNDGTIPAISTGAAAADQDDTIAAIQEIAAAYNALRTDVANLRSQLGLTADETNARVLVIEEGVDSAGNINVVIPRDYDEATDELILRVLASQLTVSTDDDVKLDVEVYRKRARSALSADLAPSFTDDDDVPVLSTTEQWVEFDLGQLGMLRDDVLTIELITNGANDTNAEEVVLHGMELVYRSCLVSYHEFEDAAQTQPLR